MGKVCIPVRYKCNKCIREKTVLYPIGGKITHHMVCECRSPMERKTTDAEIVRLERAAICRPSNEDHTRRMRHCESCEIPLGTMTRRQFLRRYVRNQGLCDACGRPAVYAAYPWFNTRKET